MTLPIPDEALNSHIGILGKTGSGKTYTAKGLVERLFHARRQTAIIDPTGAWYGLRTGFDLPIFGGRHGDIEIDDKAGEAVASVIVEQRTSAIVDLSLLSGGKARRFMTAFAHRLRAKPPGALWLVIDEADEFLPQQLQPDMTNLFGDLKWMVRRGRLNGFRIMMVTQRPAEIAKAVLTQIETLVAHRLTAPQDRKAIEEWVKGHHAPEEAKEVLSSLASLERGTAWVWAPDLNILSRSEMPRIETFDSSRTPDADEEAPEPPALAALDLSAIREAMAVAEDEPAKAKGSAAPAWPDQRAEVTALRATVATLEAAMKRATGLVAQADAAVQAIHQTLTEIPITISAPQREDPAPPPRREEPRKPEAPTPVPPRARQTQGLADGETSTITGPQRRVLNALAWWQAFGIGQPTSEQVAFIAGYSASSSGYANLKGAMRGAGLLVYPQPGRVQLTDAGAAEAESPTSPVSREVFHDAVRAKMSGPQTRLLDPLLGAYPDAMRSADLAVAAGYSVTSSGFNNLRGSMRSLGFIDYPSSGTVRAADWLFP